jgi:hypothetical protein
MCGFPLNCSRDVYLLSGQGNANTGKWSPIQVIPDMPIKIFSNPCIATPFKDIGWREKSVTKRISELKR